MSDMTIMPPRLGGNVEQLESSSCEPHNTREIPGGFKGMVLEILSHLPFFKDLASVREYVQALGAHRREAAEAFIQALIHMAPEGQRQVVSETARIALKPCLEGYEPLEPHRLEKAVSSSQLAARLHQQGIATLSDFDLTKQTDTGGMSGSKQVQDLTGTTYQLKFPAVGQSLTQNIKAGFSEKWNVGELLASRLIKALLPDEVGVAHSPDIKLVFDPVKKEMLIASKYLSDVDDTLEQFARKRLPNLPKGARPVISFEPTPAPELCKPDHLYLGDEKYRGLRAGVARAIAAAAFVGDHDINPGNLLVTKNPTDGAFNVAKIDHGHAWNDLINAMPALGGGKVVPGNAMLDYFSPERTVAHLNPARHVSKLARFYRGVTDSSELATAMQDMRGRAPQVRKAIMDARSDFGTLLSELMKQPRENRAAIAMIEKTLRGIATRLGYTPPSMDGIEASPEDKINRTLDGIFDQFQQFADAQFKAIEGVKWGAVTAQVLDETEYRCNAMMEIAFVYNDYV